MQYLLTLSFHLLQSCRVKNREMSQWMEMQATHLKPVELLVFGALLPLPLSNYFIKLLMIRHLCDSFVMAALWLWQINEL